MVLPFVDESSLKSAAELEGLVEVLRRILPRAQQDGVEVLAAVDVACGRAKTSAETVCIWFVRWSSCRLANCFIRIR